MAKKQAPEAGTQEPQPSQASYPRPAEISREEAAKLVKVKAAEVFAVNEYADRYHVITTDGQRLVAEK